MKGFLATACIATGTLLGAGCIATHKYVRNTTAPIQAKADQVGEQASRNGQAIEDTKNQLKQVDEKAQSGINAAQEKAATADQHALTADQHAQTADQHAGDALNKANQAGQTATQAVQSADQANHGLDSLRNVVANIDDYKAMGEPTVVHFAIAKDTLTKDEKAKLDQVASQVGSQARYFITVEGFTDQTGDKAYNNQLSRRRADQVIAYLVGSKNIPVFRIHTVGLGDQKLIDDGKGKKAREASRRVEITVYTAKPLTASAGGN